MMTWIVSADMAVGEFVAFQAGYRSAAKTTSGETVKVRGEGMEALM